MIDRVLNYIYRKRFKRNIRRWFKQKGDQTLRLDYPLNPNSVVFDVGGFHGDFAADIFSKYSCEVYVFEPVQSFLAQLHDRFHDQTRVKIFPFGLGGRTETVTISLAGDRSSHVQDTSLVQTETVQIKGFMEFVRAEHVPRIDLLKLNIEGAEFDLLEKIISEGWVTNIRDIQVQFHNCAPDSPRRRAALRAQLSRTHELTYDFYFVWENWRRKI